MDTVELNNGWLWPVLASPFIGSFLGVLIARLPQDEGGRGEGRPGRGRPSGGRPSGGRPSGGWRSVATGRSACPACGHTLGVPDLVPVASFLALRGRCRFCAAPIPRFHLWVELAALAVAAWAAAAGERDGVLWAGCALGWTLLTLGWIDAICLRLPDALTLPLILAGLAEAAWLEPDTLGGRAAGAAAGYAGFRGLAWAYRRLRGREGLGQGDAKLLSAGGAWVGGLLLPDVLLGAAVAGLAWALRRGRPDPNERVPFGPFLAGGIWLVWLYA